MGGEVMGAVRAAAACGNERLGDTRRMKAMGNSVPRVSGGGDVAEKNA